jgi:hypothetical protein
MVHRGVLVAILAMLALFSGPSSMWAQTIPAPGALTAPSDPSAPPVETPKRVKIGAYINDINEIDLRRYAFVMDLYVWFRWTDPDIDPSKTFEFMNLSDEAIVDLDYLYPEGPVIQKDQYRYQLARYQGVFSTKFNVGRYPYDHHALRIVIEDSDMGADELVFEVDELSVNPAIEVPGYHIGQSRLTVAKHPYKTAFGDLEETDVSHYSRVELITPIRRP